MWPYIVGVLVLLLLVGAYCLGYSDGKLSERETWLFKRLDELIAALPVSGSDKA